MITVVNAHPRRRFSSAAAKQLAGKVLKGEKKRAKELCVVFTNHRLMRRINKKFLGHDYATDVIAFLLDADPGIEGEVYVNLDKAREQSAEQRTTMMDETRRYIVHGVLHLCGWRDKTLAAKKWMSKREDVYLER
ncbi:MAG: rRNA maturation RNase YbeY [Ignavibacteriales bacterium]|nr:rRNA maturation RNase YbeY [Ignavibacteriales bacterium]